MSVSDYIKHKRVGTQLKDVLPNSKKQAPAVFDDQMYIDFKQYTVENTIMDQKLIENSLIPSGSNLIFNVVKKVNNCPKFPICYDTNQRTNRVPMSQVYYYQQPPPVYWKQKQANGQIFHNQRPFGQKAHLNRPLCKCIVNRKFSNSLYMDPNIQALKYATG